MYKKIDVVQCPFKNPDLSTLLVQPVNMPIQQLFLALDEAFLLGPISVGRQILEFVSSGVYLSDVLTSVKYFCNMQLTVYLLSSL